MTNNQASNPIGMDIGQYHIVAPLGGGGMAMVYRAHQRSMGRDVAIKVIKPELAIMKDFTERFGREAKMVASLSHANILKIFDYGQQGDMWYLVMELLSGGSLADHIAKGPVPISFALRLFDQIASALDYAHRRGIVHRDLKPQNVLLDDANNALLTDFGLAKLVNSTSGLTMTGAAVGTPSYMAPEQWSSGAVDLRADIYSLGIMLFEMLTGQLPFEGDTPFRLMHMHIYEDPRSLSALKPNTSPDIEHVIARALAKQPDNRFQSAGEMASALRKAVTGVTNSFVADRPSSPAPVSTRNLSAPVDRITLLPFDGEAENQGQNGGSGSNIVLERVTLLPVDDVQAPKPSVKQSMKASVPPAPFEDTAYPAPRQGVVAPEQRAINSSKKAAEKAALMARKQQNTNRMMMAMAGLAVVVIGVFAVLFIRNNGGQNGLPTTAPLGGIAMGANVGTATSTLAPEQTETPAASNTPRNTATASNTPPNTATRRPTWTREPTNTPRPVSTRRPTNLPTANTSSTGGGATQVIGTIRTEIDIHAGVGEGHPVLFRARVGDQFPVEGKILENGHEWFQITLQGGAPAWLPASAIAVTPGSYIPVVTPRPKPPKQ